MQFGESVHFEFIRQIVNGVRIILSHFWMILGSYLAICFISSRKLPWLPSKWSDSKYTLNAKFCFVKNSVTSIPLVKTSPHLFFSYVICSLIKLSIDIPKMLDPSVSFHTLKESWWDWLASCSDIFSLFFYFWNPPCYVNLLTLLFLFPNSKQQKQYNDLSFGLNRSQRLGIRLLGIRSFSTCLVKKHLVNLRSLWMLADSILSWYWSSSGPFTGKFF